MVFRYKLAFLLVGLGLLLTGLGYAQSPSWQSYADQKHSIPSDEFTDLHCTVYMSGVGFIKNQNYKIVCWDGVGYKVQSEIQTARTPAGKLEGLHVFNDTDRYGDWQCTVYLPCTYSPVSYDPDDINIVADDWFYVAPTAIPEIEQAITGISLVGICFGIYWWKRRR